jgi:hypothetical protein
MIYLIYFIGFFITGIIAYKQYVNAVHCPNPDNALARNHATMRAVIWPIYGVYYIWCLLGYIIEFLAKKLCTNKVSRTFLKVITKNTR